MARIHSGQMALYEALNKDRFKAAQKKELTRVAQTKAQMPVPVQPVNIPPQQPKNPDAVWTKKPKFLGLNNGKFEAYVPYPIAVTVVMALVLLLVMAYSFGHFLGKRDTSPKVAKSAETTVDLSYTAKAAKELARSSRSSRSALRGLTPAATTTTVTTEAAEEPAPRQTVSTGEYVIVLKQLANSRDLAPVKEFFGTHGIATEIKNYRGSYFLVTTQKYDNIGRGTAFDEMVRKIKQVGADYKPPEGYNGFGAQMFSDAYGRKM